MMPEHWRSISPADKKLWLLMGCAFLVFAASCDPPGKPKEEPVSSEDATDFQTLYGYNCAGCHGSDGKNGPGRPLNNPVYLALIPKDVLQQTIENGRPGTAMPPWAHDQGGPLTPKQVVALVDGIEQNWVKPMELPALPPYAVTSQSGNADQGKKLFLKDCFMCHGPGAPIGSVSSPSYLALVSDQMLRTSIIVGRADLGMPDYRNLNMGKALSDQDVTDLVAYLASMRPAYAIQENAHVQENGSGQGGATTRGNEGSGHGPGSPRHEENEGNKSTGASSQGGPK
ncbi:MAG: c-type cytochrome [Acidobacteriaceae bacterium]|nr:c-type cytochrome [Acidobacteriaceae bacterium]MBV9764650.1 c-type cytochrome [Acidobacteriaceae bacterium]